MVISISSWMAWEFMVGVLCLALPLSYVQIGLQFFFERAQTFVDGSAFKEAKEEALSRSPLKYHSRMRSGVRV